MPPVGSPTQLLGILISKCQIPSVGSWLDTVGTSRHSVFNHRFRLISRQCLPRGIRETFVPLHVQNSDFELTPGPHFIHDRLPVLCLSAMTAVANVAFGAMYT